MAEEEAPLLGTRSQPTLDREALEIAARNKIAEWYGAEWSPQDGGCFLETDDGGVTGDLEPDAMLEWRGVRMALDAAEAAVRPLPTREQIEQAATDALLVADNLVAPGYSARIEADADDIAEAIAPAIERLFTGGKE